MKGAECIRHSRLVNQSYGFSEFKSSDEAAVKRRLSDRSLYIGEIDVHPHDHPLGVEWNLQPGDSVVEVEFCKVEEPMRKPTSFFRWLVHGDTTATPKKPTLSKSKRAV